MQPIRWAWRGLALLSLGGACGALALALRHSLQTPQPLTTGLPGDERIDREHGGEISYIVAGPTGARPIVLLHDFYPGASNYEHSSLVPRLARAYRVYAPDWLGFGMSERPPLAYTGEFYASALAGYLRDVVAQPAVVIASGRAANIAARAASDAPAVFDRLVLVSPHIKAGLQLDPTMTQIAVRLAERASIGIVPYALVSARPVLRLLAMRRGLGAATEDMLDHAWAAARQFNARYPVLAALTGELDLPLQNLLPLLEPPLLIVAGEADQRHTRDQMEVLAILNPYTDLDIIPGAGAAVCQDQPARFVSALSHWLASDLPRHPAAETLRIGSSTAAPPRADGNAAGMNGRPARKGNASLRVAPAAAQTRSTGEPHAATPGSRATATLGNHPATGSIRSEEPNADEAWTGKHPAARKSAASRPKTATEPSAERQAPKETKGAQTTHGVGGRALRGASAPTRPRGSVSSSRRTATQPDTAADEAKGTPHPAEKRKPAGRDRARSQTQPRGKRGAPADGPEPGRE